VERKRYILKNDLLIILEEKKIDIVLHSETNLTKNSNFKITGYEFISVDHPDEMAHGGAAFLIPNKIEHNPHPSKQQIIKLHPHL